MNTNKVYRTITKSQPKTIRLTIFAKADPRDDGMLDELSNDESETKSSIDKESSYSKKSEQSEITQESNQESNISPQKINKDQSINRYTAPPPKNDFYNKYPTNNFVNATNNVYYGPYNRNTLSIPRKVIIYNRRRRTPIIKFRDCLDYDICGIF